MQIFVRGSVTKALEKTICLDVEPTDYIMIVKAKIQVWTDVFSAAFNNYYYYYSRIRKESHTSTRD